MQPDRESIADAQTRTKLADYLISSLKAASGAVPADVPNQLPVTSDNSADQSLVTGHLNIDSSFAGPFPPAASSTGQVIRDRSILFAIPMVHALLAGRKTQTRRLVMPQPAVDGGLPAECPYGRRGSRLWVREKWGYRGQFFDHNAPPRPPFIYAADGPPSGARRTPWRPSLHMPRAACRLALRVTSTRCERLQEITDSDAAAEGCPPTLCGGPREWFADYWSRFNDARGTGWAANPWVWVVCFEVERAAEAL